MRYYDVNVPRVAQVGFSSMERLGCFLWRWKNIAVRAGYEVVGSGDGLSRFAWNGETSALPGAQQGLGGDFDCWLQASSDQAGAANVAGDATNANAWCVLQSPVTGRQILLCETDQASAGWQGYGRIAVLRPTLGGWLGSTAGAATIPALVTGEHFLFGTRASASGTVVLPSNNGFLHLWSDDSGPEPAVGCMFMEVGLSHNISSFCVMPALETSPHDTDPVVYLATTSNSVLAGVYWNPESSSFVAIQTDDTWGGAWGSGRGGVSTRTTTTILRRMAPIVSSSPANYSKGMLHPAAPRWCTANRNQILLTASGETWFSAGNLAFPWPANTRPRG
jgi:hypothetical protein